MTPVKVEVYDQSPEQYDLFQTGFFKHGSPAAAAAYQRMFAALSLQPPMKVLEVGVGTGLNLPLYPKGTQVTGIDRSAPMLTIARRRAQEASASVELVHSDAEAIPFGDEKFDAVVSTFVLCSCQRPTNVLEGIVRSCRVGGVIGLFDFHKAKHNQQLLADQTLLHETLLEGIVHGGRRVAVCDSFYQLEDHLPPSQTEVVVDEHLEDSISAAFRATTLRRTR